MERTVFPSGEAPKKGDRTVETIFIKGVRILDPAQGRDEMGNILITDGKIAAVGQVAQPDGAQIIDGTGLCASPGFVDIHVHLRDPGFTHKEDIFSGCRAAAAGGFTAVACMPNTNPPLDTPQSLTQLLERAKAADARIYPVAAITRGQQGAELCDYPALQAAGAVAISDDGRPVKNAAIMEEAMKQAYALHLPVISHCEDLDIIDGGIIHKGSVSEELGVKGMDRASEDSVTAREIALAAATGTAIHIAHVSTQGSVALIRDAKRRGVQVTCETAPHYMLLTHEELRRRDANWRMNPPLREREDCQAIVEGVRDGTIDAIITDHAPHAPQEKADFLKAPNGIIGLETSFAASCTALVKTGVISLSRLVELMAVAPRRILNLPGESLRVGQPADITIFDPGEEWTFTLEDIRSKSRNTPFLGMTFTGKVKYTLLEGRITYQDK